MKVVKQYILEVATLAFLVMFSNIDAEKAEGVQKTPETSGQVAEVIYTENSLSETQPKTTQEYVAHYFSDTPVLIEVARCESRFRQYNESGQVLRGKVEPTDVGVMQINEYFHGAAAEKIGVDLLTLEGNLAYARYLHEKEGLTPWSASESCWRGARHIAQR